MRLASEDLIGGPVEERRICLDQKNVNGFELNVSN